MTQPKQLLSRLLVVGLGLSVLSGCGSLNRVFNNEEDDILPGRRIPVEINQAAATSPVTNRVQISAPQSGGNWSQSAGGSNNLAPHLASDRSLTELWNRDIGDGTNNRRSIVSQPLVVQNIVFTLDATNSVRASALTNGRTLWKRDVKPTRERSGFFGGGLAYANGIVYTATGFGELIALQARSGREQWRRPLPGIAHGAPAVANGLVIVQTEQNKTRAFNAATGQRVWDHEGAETQTGILGAAVPGIAGDRVIVGYSSGEVFGLELATGNEVWSDTLAVAATGSLTSEIGDVVANPVIAGTTAYVVSNSGRTAAFDIGRGSLLWEATQGGSQTPVVSGNALFLVTADARVVALDRSNGGVIWNTQLKKGRERFLRSDFPVAWRGPLLIGGRLMIGSSQGEVVSLNPATGAVLGDIDIGAGIAVAPSGGNGVALFVTDRARLVALR